MPKLTDAQAPKRSPRAKPNLRLIAATEEPKMFPEEPDTETPEEDSPELPEESEAANNADDDEDATETTPEGAEEGSSKLRRRAKPALAARAQRFAPDLSKFKSLEESADYLRVVLYGDYGVGKSTSAMTLAERGKIAVIDPENSIRRSALARQGINTDNIMQWPDWSYEGVEQFFHTVKAELEREPGSIFAVVIDTVTSLAQFWLEAAVKDSLARPAMQKKHPGRTQWDVFQDDYGVLTEQIKTMITRQLFLLPCHVVVIAHARRAENEDGAVRVGPALSPAAQGALLTYSDWVFRQSMVEKGGNEHRIVETSPRGLVEAKERFGVLGSRLNDVTMLDMLEEWEAGAD